jgi:type IX secretion system PorP/SprF family membrane protein
MKRYIIVIAFIIFVLKVSFSQDFHYAQFDANPGYLNPALTGERMSNFKGIMVNLNYRDQMARYTNSPGSYRSFASGLDATVGPRFSIGEFINNNNSSDGTFNTFNFLLAGSYKLINVVKENEHQQNFSVGLQMGFLNKSIRQQNSTFDSQYTGTSLDGFDRNISSGENFVKESYFKFDMNFGVYYRTTLKNKRLSLFGGAAIYHLTTPNESFIGQYSSIPLKFNIHCGSKYKINEELSLMGQFLYMNQAKANELNLGMLFYYKIKDTSFEPIIGLNWRNKNAIIFQLGLGYKEVSFRVSYCLVTNYLKDYRNKGLEFSLIYTFNKPQRDYKAPMF